MARLGGLSPHENLLVVVDQFEEVFRFADLALRGDAPDDAPAFVKLLLEAAAAADARIYIVLTMRSDFLGDCARFRQLPEAISDSQYLIPRLTRDELQAAITGPVGVRGGAIAPALVQHLLNAIGDDMDQLPLLQHALMRAWDHWETHAADGRPIELGDLEAIGGMTQALSRHADEAYASLADDEARLLAERMFKGLTERGPDNREIRRPTLLARLAEVTGARIDQLRPVIDVFRAPGRSFLVPPYPAALADDSVIDISHESLIRQWQRLRGWVEEEAESRATYVRLVDAARLWQAGRGGLWGEPDLTFAKQWEERQQPTAAWAAQYAPGFETAREFLRESTAAHAAALAKEQQQAEAERLARERELQQEIRHTRRLRRLLTAAVAAGVVAAVLAVAAIALYVNVRRARDASEQQRALADIQRLASVSASVGEQYPQRALLLAAEGIAAERVAAAATRGVRTPDADQALRDTLGAAWGVSLFMPGDPNVPAVVSPDGRWLAVAGRTGACHLVDLHAPDPAKATHLLRAHAGPITALTISPDSRWLVTASMDATARIWDLSGAVPPTGPVVLDHADAVTAVAISATQRWLVTGSADATIRVWPFDRAVTGAPAIVLRGSTSPLISAVFTPDDRWLASASGFPGVSGTGDVRLWEISSLATSPRSVPLLSSGLPITAVSVSPGGGWLIAYAPEASFLWDLRGTDPRTTQRQTSQTVVLSADDRWLIYNTGFEDAIFLEETRAPSKRIQLKGHRSRTRLDRRRPFVFSPNNRLVVTTGFGDPEAIAWDTTAQDPSARPTVFRGHASEVSGTAISPDGRWLATSARNSNVVLMWNLDRPGDDAQRMTGFERTGPLLQFTPDGRWLTGRAPDGDEMHLWKVPDGRAAASEFVFSEGAIEDPRGLIRRKALFTPDARRLLAIDTAARVMSTDADDQGDRYSALLSGSSVYAQHPAAIGSDGRFVALGQSDSEITVWDLTKPVAPPRELPVAAPVATLTISPDGRQLAAGSQRGFVRVWDLTSAATDVVEFKSGEYDVGALAFSADSRRLAIGDSGGGVRLWDVAARRLERTWTLTPAEGASHLPGVGTLAISPDGRWLAGRAELAVWVWDLRDAGSVGKPLTGPDGLYSALAFTPDSRRLVASGNSLFALLWDVSEAGRQQAAIVLRGHEVDVVASAISGDGRWLVTASHDASVRLWDLQATNVTQSSIALRGHQRAIRAVAFASDNRNVLTFSEDGTARRWAIEATDLLTRARGVAGRNLNRQEWNRYFPGVAYRKTFPDLPIHETMIDEIAEMALQSRIDDGLVLVDPRLRDEAQRAATDDLVEQAKWLAAQGDGEEALRELQAAISLDPTISGTLQEVNRLAATALVGRARLQIVREELPEIEPSKTLLRRALVLDARPRFDPETHLRDLTRDRFLVSARARLEYDDLDPDVLDFNTRLLEAARAFEPSLGNSEEFTALSRRIDTNRPKAELAKVTAEWERLLEEGRISDVMASHREFAKRHPDVAIPASDLNALCWNGALNNAAASVKAACDRAVILAPGDANIRDSRGLARALTGDREGAIADWQYFADHWTGPDGPKQQRRDWIARWRAGQPFVLTEELRRELLGP